MKPGYEAIAHNVRFIRDKESQDEFGQRLGTNQKTISAYERGINKPSSQMLLKLSQMAGIDAGTLLTKKLRQDREGNIINAKPDEKEILHLRKELDQLIKTFEADTQRFFKGIQSLNKRLEQIERHLRKKI